MLGAVSRIGTVFLGIECDTDYKCEGDCATAQEVNGVIDRASLVREKNDHLQWLRCEVRICRACSACGLSLHLQPFDPISHAL